MAKKDLKFLSKSVILKESGLPFINQLIIISVFIIITLFITWSNHVNINDTINLSGSISLSDNMTEFIVRVPSRNISSIELGNRAYINIPGITNKQALKAKVNVIYNSPFYDKNNNAYFKIELLPLDDLTLGLEESIITGMDTKVEVVIGSRTLLQYFLGPLWDTSQN